MSLKKIKGLDCILLFALSIIFHFIYELLPTSVFVPFFPINESIFEHMKIIYSPIIFITLTDYLLLKKYDMPINNLFTSSFFTSFISIIVYLLIYLPIYHIIGENMFFSITLLFIIFVFSQYLSYLIISQKDIKGLNILSIILIIIGYIIFGYLSYKPIQNDLFYDKLHRKYGLNIYKI